MPKSFFLLYLVPRFILTRFLSLLIWMFIYWKYKLLEWLSMWIFDLSTTKPSGNNFNTLCFDWSLTFFSWRQPRNHDSKFQLTLGHNVYLCTSLDIIWNGIFHIWFDIGSQDLCQVDDKLHSCQRHYFLASNLI